MKNPIRLLHCRSGAGAAELCLVAPFAVGLMMAALNISLMAYSAAMLHFAVEDAARCGAVRAGCRSGTPAQADSTLVVSYAQRSYAAPTTAPTFQLVADSACVIVQASATYKVALGIAHFSVPLNARACYPKQAVST